MKFTLLTAAYFIANSPRPLDDDRLLRARNLKTDILGRHDKRRRRRIASKGKND